MDDVGGVASKTFNTEDSFRWNPVGPRPRGRRKEGASLKITSTDTMPFLSFGLFLLLADGDCIAFSFLLPSSPHSQQQWLMLLLCVLRIVSLSDSDVSLRGRRRWRGERGARQ